MPVGVLTITYSLKYFYKHFISNDFPVPPRPKIINFNGVFNL